MVCISIHAKLSSILFPLYTKMHNFYKISYKYLVNKLLKLKTKYFCPSFELLQKKHMKIRDFFL